MKTCKDDYEINPKTERCVKKCKPGQVRNPETSRCSKPTSSAPGSVQSTTLPTLYEKDSKGKLRIWNTGVVVEGGGKTFIKTTFGLQNGKQQTSLKEVKKGKNIGKANETTKLQQATAEAKSLWEKKKDKGYSETVGGEVKLRPMLAQDFHKNKNKIVFPCATQPKLDGIRCLFVDGKLYSRTGKEFTFPGGKQITFELKSKLKDQGMVLDGELFSPDLDFQTIVSVVKNSKEQNLGSVKFWVFDTIDPKTGFIERYKKTEKAIRGLKFTKIVEINDNVAERQLAEIHAEYIQQGYEGTMIRNRQGGYKPNQRSSDLQKFKDFKDDEFKIVGFTEGTGNDKGAVVWKVETKSGQKFSVRPRGTVEKRREWFNRGNSFIGKNLTVRFQELTNEGIPRFPVGVGIRDYE